VRKLTLSAGDVQPLPTVVEIKALEVDGASGGGAVVRTNDGKEQIFHEAVITAPLEWLTWSEEVSKQSLISSTTELVEGIPVDHIEKVSFPTCELHEQKNVDAVKVFITFPIAFWQSCQNTESPPPPNLIRNTDNDSSSYMSCLSPTSAVDTSPNRLSEESYSLAEFALRGSHPTLLFYIYGVCSTKLADLVHSSTDSRKRYDRLNSFFRPYFRHLPNYSTCHEHCDPVAFFATNWQHGKLASYRSSCNFQVDTPNAKDGVVVLRRRLRKRQS
jgi:hypothetical protein